MSRLWLAFFAVCVLGLPLAGVACSTGTDSPAQVDRTEQRSLGATARPRSDVNTDPNVHKALLAPAAVLSDADMQQHAFDNREAAFR
jgi:hypothetical protein